MQMTLRDETAAGRQVGSIVLEVPQKITLRELIRLRVREEVARYNAAPTDRFLGLVKPTQAEEDLNGYRMLEKTRIDWEKQADAAVKSFQRNGFVDRRGLGGARRRGVLRAIGWSNGVAGRAALPSGRVRGRRLCA